MAKLGKESTCTYSRYADDITFSTNKKEFPELIALKNEYGEWVPSKRLIAEIERTDFKINHQKTSMQFKIKRQLVTGLVVNKKVNVSKDYYKTIRSICHSLFKYDSYYIGENIKKGGYSENIQETQIIKKTNIISGHLSYIYQVKKFSRKKKQNKEKESSFHNLYKNFLIYDQLYKVKKPLIVCEGKTDIIYLKCALKSLHLQNSEKYSFLIEEKDKKLFFKLNFFKPSRRTRDVLGSLNGVNNIFNNLISNYINLKRKKIKTPSLFPIIVLFDNDDKVKKQIADKRKNKKVGCEEIEKDLIYFIKPNLYLAKIPLLNTKKEETVIEDYFPQKVLNEKLEGKKFDLKNKEKNKDNYYSKSVFAEKIIIPKVGNSSVFKNFNHIFDMVKKILDFHAKII